MIKLLAHLRFMQLFAHAAHNLVNGPSFVPDHAFFGDAYSAHETDFDNVVERVIGLYGESHIDFAQLTMDAAQQLKSAKISAQVSNEQFFESQLKHEAELCKLVDQLCKAQGVSEGVKQLLGNIADVSEGRQYKIKQRLSL